MERDERGGGGGRFGVDGSGLHAARVGTAEATGAPPGEGVPGPREGGGLRASRGEGWEAISCIAGESKLVRTENLLSRRLRGNKYIINKFINNRIKKEYNVV